MQDKKSRTERNAPTSLAISMAMRIRWYDAECIAQYGRSRATLDATGRCNRASFCTVFGGRHGHQFWRKKSSCGVVEIAFQS